MTTRPLAFDIINFPFFVAMVHALARAFSQVTQQTYNVATTSLSWLIRTRF